MIVLDGAILVAMLVVMGVGWAVQRAAGNGGWTDVFWTYGTGVTCAVGAVVPIMGWAAPSWRGVLVAGLMAVWALRLGTYVAVRVAGGAEDVRYTVLRELWGAKLQGRMFWLLICQAPITALLGLAVLYAGHRAGGGVRVADMVGVGILAGAIVGESVADGQMRRFKADPRRGAVCEVGLWGWSRHPNYFFEVAGWVAYPVIGTDWARPVTLLGWIAPVLMFGVIRYGTGIPPLEAAMVRAKGEAYRAYQARVSALVPWRPKGQGGR